MLYSFQMIFFFFFFFNCLTSSEWCFSYIKIKIRNLQKMSFSADGAWYSPCTLPIIPNGQGLVLWPDKTRTRAFLSATRRRAEQIWIPSPVPSDILYKYILLVRVICEKYRFREQSNFPRRYKDFNSLISLAAITAREIGLSSQPVFFANNPH